MQNSYFEALGIEPIDKESEKERLREAYNKAHDIRKFEIEMYWRRSAYLWTFQGAALGGLALILSTAKPEVICFQSNLGTAENCFHTWITSVAIVAIWCFGVFAAYVWLLLLRGAKFWQNNWERHVDLLEDQFSGALYKTYPVSKSDAPYSVSKLNELMAGFTLLMWLLIGATTLLIVYGPGFQLAYWAGFFVLLFFAYFFDSCLRMSGFGQQMTKHPGENSDEIMIVVRPTPSLTEKEFEIATHSASETSKNGN